MGPRISGTTVPMGFAGLADLVSDGAVELRRLTSATKKSVESNQAPKKPETARPVSTPRHPDTQLPHEASGRSQDAPTAGGSKAGWLWGIAVVAVILVVINGTDSTPVPERTADMEATAPTDTPSEPHSDSKDVVREAIPPVGTGRILTYDQIRYCVAEDIRIDAANSLVNNYSRSEVDRFNSLVRDYNSRCSDYQYRAGSLEAVQREMAKIRPLLEQEGRARFEQEDSEIGRLFEHDRTLRPPQPNDTVRSIQQRLNVLGYEAGAADGLMGTSTVLAIQAFQSAQGLTVDGFASRALLEQLDRNVARESANFNERASPQMSGQSVPLSSSLQEADLSALSESERRSLESACNVPRLMEGPAAYNRCRSDQLAELRRGPREPDLSALSESERRSLESACNVPRLMEGPAAYNRCRSDQLAELRRGPREPDLSALSESERRSLESACNVPRLMEGPAAYNRCRSDQLAELRRGPREPDLSALGESERRSLESACNVPRLMEGPAAYNRCKAGKLKELGY